MNDTAAHRIQGVVTKRLGNISVFPNSGTPITVLNKNIPVEVAGIRRVIAANYIILYEHFESEKLAMVTHIFHQTQNYGRIFNGDH